MSHRRLQPIRWIPATPAATLALLLLCACSREHASAHSGAARRDSAGVAIVTSARAAWAHGDGWRVDPDPRVDIASAADGAGPQIAEVRGALRLGDGRIVVANGGSMELLAFDRRGKPAGTLASSAGGSKPASLGEIGAGEGGGMWMWDATELRLWSFDGRGQVTGSRHFPGDQYGIFPQLRGVFADGSLLLSAQPGNVFVISPRPTRDTVTLLRYAFAPPRLDTLGAERGAEIFTVGDANGARRLSAPFARTTHIATHGQEMWVGDTERPELRVYDTAGRLRRIVRWPQPPRPIPAAAKDGVLHSFIRQARGAMDPAAARDLAAKLPFPASYPAFAALVIDRQGNAWLQDGDPARSSSWTVIDREGRLLGAVELPAGLDPLDIGRDYVLGRWRSAGGAEHVRLHRLHR